jgi:hypothetical protein
MLKSRCLAAILIIFQSQVCWSFEWPSEVFSFQSRSGMLSRGQTAVSLTADQGRFKNTYSSAGRIKPISKFTVKRNSVGTLENSEEITNVLIKKIRYVPTWSYGLTSSWSIGVGLPIIQTEIESPRVDAFGGTALQKDSSVGDVSFFSKEKIYSTRVSRLALLQRAKFPSAEREARDEAVAYGGDPTGYAVGGGAIYEYLLARSFSVTVSLFHDVNLPDQLVYTEEGEDEVIKIDRNPGDTTTASLSTDLTAHKNWIFSAGYIISEKTVDEIQTTQELAKLEQRASLQMAELGFGYVENQMREKNALAARLKLYSTLAGKNTEEANILSLQLQYIY